MKSEHTILDVGIPTENVFGAPRGTLWEGGPANWYWYWHRYSRGSPPGGDPLEDTPGHNDHQHWTMNNDQ